MKDINTEALKAARALVEKLDAVHDDPAYRHVWATAQFHNGSYAGPKYAEELNALRAALSPPVTDISGQEGEREALERDWNRLMDALGCDETDAALAKIAALSQPPAVQVPEGYKLVPIEPTPEFIAPFVKHFCENETWARHAWREAIALAPSPAAVND